VLRALAGFVGGDGLET